MLIFFTFDQFKNESQHSIMIKHQGESLVPVDKTYPRTMNDANGLDFTIASFLSVQYSKSF